MTTHENINITHFFKYRNKNYGFNLFIFAACSELLQNNINDYISQKEINLLINQKDSNVNLSEKSINDFIHCCHGLGNNIHINNENAISLDYLAKEYQITQLFNLTQDYILKHQSELCIQYFKFYQNINIDDNTKKEDLMSTYLFYHINNEQLLEFPIPALHRIITKFFNNHINMNEQEEKKFKNDLILFLFKCLDKYGRDASVLFGSINKFQIENIYINQLLTKYHSTFDFHFINSMMIRTNYELQNEIIQKELQIKSIQESTVKFLQEMKELQEENKKEIFILKQENKEQINRLKNEYQQQFHNLNNENKQYLENNKQLNDKIQNLENDIQKYKQELNSNINKQNQDINNKFVQEKVKNDEQINNLQNKFQQQLNDKICTLENDIKIQKQEMITNEEASKKINNIKKEIEQKINNLQDQNAQKVSKSEITQRITSIQNEISLLENKCSKSFVYKNDYQFNGIINYLRTKSNNRIENLINISSSSNDSEYENPINVTLFEDMSKYFKSGDKPNSWICFEFKNHRIIPTDYIIRSFSAGQNANHPRYWVIEASNDNQHWETIDEQNNCSNLRGRSIVYTFKINNQQWKQFKYIRMRQTGSNWFGWNCLIIDSFDIYGQLI